MARLLVAVAGLTASSSAIFAQSSPTLQSGAFGDERLILAADTDSATVSGYYREGDRAPWPSAVGTHSPTLPCTVLKNGTFEQLGDCARRNPDGSYAIAPDTLGKLDFDRWGLATLAIREQGYAYVRRNGRALVVPTFDNGPDEFIGGLARVRIDGKIGYADRHLKLVIPASYDGAHRFARSGRAWACTGCETVSDGEHSFYRGGTAVCLDRRGRQRPAAECGNAGWLPPQLRE